MDTLASGMKHLQGSNVIMNRCTELSGRSKCGSDNDVSLDGLASTAVAVTITPGQPVPITKEIRSMLLGVAEMR